MIKPNLSKTCQDEYWKYVMIWHWNCQWSLASLKNYKKSTFRRCINWFKFHLLAEITLLLMKWKVLKLNESKMIGDFDSFATIVFMNIFIKRTIPNVSSKYSEFTVIFDIRPYKLQRKTSSHVISYARNKNDVNINFTWKLTHLFNLMLLNLAYTHLESRRVQILTLTVLYELDDSNVVYGGNCMMLMVYTHHMHMYMVDKLKDVWNRVP